MGYHRTAPTNTERGLRRLGKTAKHDEGVRPSDNQVVDPGERIAKRLARAGIASRRDAEMMIAANRVSVNGKIITTPAVNVQKSDVILVDGRELRPAERTRLWLYHKPAGLVTTTRDPEGRPTVFSQLPSAMPRVLSVGRLDINTEGLLLLTNDGGLARLLELPSTGWLRRYRVRAHGKVNQADLDSLKNGIAVAGVFYGAVDATIERVQGSNIWLNVALREGKNREIKNILGALNLEVTRLIRVSFGPFQLADLEVGAVRELRGRVLRDQLGERLIAEANADFDGPIYQPVAQAPAKKEREVQPEDHADRRISSTEHMKGRLSKGRVGGNEIARARLSTRVDEFVGPTKLGRMREGLARGSRERSKTYPARFADAPRAVTSSPGEEKGQGNLASARSLPRSRGANVWHAPGAKPTTPARQRAEQQVRGKRSERARNWRDQQESRVVWDRGRLPKTEEHVTTKTASNAKLEQNERLSPNLSKGHSRPHRRSAGVSADDTRVLRKGSGEERYKKSWAPRKKEETAAEGSQRKKSKPPTVPSQHTTAKNAASSRTDLRMSKPERVENDQKQGRSLSKNKIRTPSRPKTGTLHADRRR